MPVVTCPLCGQQHPVADEVEGTEVRCPACAGTFTSEPRTSLVPPPRPAVEDEDDDDDDFDYPRRRPASVSHRSGMVMGFGIASVVLFVFTLATAVVIGLFGLPLTIVGLVLGILAWRWGGEDLNKMHAGTMDRRGRGQTQAGYYCGIIGTILHSLGLLCGCAMLILVASFLGLAFSTAAKVTPITTAPAQPPAPIQPPAKQMIPTAPRLIGYLPQQIILLPR